MMREVRKGDKFQHFKGMIVEVIAIAKHSETLEDMIVYQHVGTDEVWVRPKAMFLEAVDKTKYPDVNQEYRFQKIEK